MVEKLSNKLDFRSIQQFWINKDSYLSLHLALVMILGIVTLSIGGLMLIEELTFIEAFYMTIITISTVGYTEVKELSDFGRIFLSLIIIFNLMIFTYALSVFTYNIVEGEYFRKWHFNLHKKRITFMKNHVIICGFGRYGEEIAEQLRRNKINFVVIDKSEDLLVESNIFDKNNNYLIADATMDDALLSAGIERALALISALPDDADNVYTVLTARQLNKELNIISRAVEKRTEKKLMLAGANHVVLPNQIGGYYMANLVSKPSATEFFSFLTDEIEHDIGIEEIAYENIPEKYKGKTIAELEIREQTGVNIIGLKNENKEYIVNPSADLILKPNSSFIVLGTTEQREKLYNYMEVDNM